MKCKRSDRMWFCKDKSMSYVTSLKGKPVRKQRGISVIELLVTILISTILLGMAIPNFGELRRSMNKGTALRQLEGDLRRAHAASLSKGAHIIFSVEDGGAYTVGIDYPPYNGGNGVDPVADEELFTTELPQGFVLQLWNPVMFNSHGYVINSWGWPSGGGGMLTDGSETFASFWISPSGFAEFWHW
uniref:Putative membrane protein n=1 Tax=wastewater metagenome TaxID=527639 RepID=A0A0A8KWP9_9ZZZZ